MIELEVIIHCFHLYRKKPCLVNPVFSCTKPFSYFYIRVVHSEKILFCISQFVSSFFKLFWSILRTSSFHRLFPHISFFFLFYFYSSWFLSLLLLFCVCVVYFISGFHFRISCKWFFTCLFVFFLLRQYSEELSKGAGYFVRFVQGSCKGCDWPDFPQ